MRSCDSAQACVVIPVFNNASRVGPVVRGALAHASCVLVCDDGSTDGSGAEARAAGAEVVTFPRNRGKGAALEVLFAEAVRRGFRYAICMDGDGQHLAEDLPALAEAIRTHPGALVVGARDLVAAGAPGSSQFGRKFSNFWVWFEGGVEVEDSQCGLRAYPLPEALRLQARRRRYDYEVEVLLRAAWAGLPVVSVPVGVLYPKDRVTHFRPLADNARISLLNTLTCLKLLLPLPLVPERFYERPHRPGLSLFHLRRWAWLGGPGPLRRSLGLLLGLVALVTGLPASLCVAGVLLAALLGWGAVTALAGVALGDFFLGQGMPPAAVALTCALLGVAYGVVEKQYLRPVSAAPTWTGRRRGGFLGHLIFLWVIRLFGPRPAYLLLYPVALYFVFAARPAREASRDFLDRVLGPAVGWASFRRSFQHFLSFARTLVDGFILGAKGPRGFVHQYEGLHYFQEAADAGQGAVVVTAHLGNYTVSTAMLEDSVRAKIAIVAFKGEEAQLTKLLEQGTKHVPRIIPVGTAELSSLEILRALREGTLVAMQGDRVIDAQHVRVPFFGREAAFPVGPFAIAAISGVPLISTFSRQTGPLAYAFVADPPKTLRFSREAPKEAQLKEWVADYARRLEETVRRDPYQWFNFYDFWAAEPRRL